MILVIWSVALVVSIAPQIPQLGWKDEKYLERIKERKQCLVSQDVAYQIFATSSTFYVPLLAIFVLYWKIFQTARKRIRNRREISGQAAEKSEKMNNNSKVSKSFITKRRFLRMKKSKKKSSAAEALVSSIVMMEGQSTTTMDIVEEEESEQQSNGKEEETTAFTISKSKEQQGASLQNHSHNVAVSNNVSPEKSSTTNNGSASHQSHISDISRVEILSKENPVCPASVDKLLPSRKDKKETIEAKRERKAAKTLAIITGAFVMCWLPFFIAALVMPLCGETCDLNPYVSSFFLWLGYFNSTLNPVIYTIFSPEFRQAFKRILCGVHGRGSRNFRSGRMR